MKLVYLVLGSSLLLASCRKEPVVGTYDGQMEPLAGACTVQDQTSYAFTYKVNGLSEEQSLQFFVGNSFFNQNWVEAPSSTIARDGLGPLFNSKSCAGCHFRDGRGLPYKGQGLLFRLGTPDGSVGGSMKDAIYGGQLQDQGISTVSSEGDMNISYTEVIGYYDDGTTYSLRIPNYTISGQLYGPVGASVLVSPRVAQQMVGLGLLELIPEAALLAKADEFDLDKDGISGRANYVHDVLTGGTSIGRFGWKANVPSIPQQVAGAFNGDIGITTYLFPNENHTSNETSCNGLPNGGSPEIADDDLAAVILYSRTLAVPAQRKSANVTRGKQLFNELNCNACHATGYKTGNGGSINPLKNVRIYPYTDLLLHDMGDELADGLPDYLANGNEWRTPPLWGLGMINIVNGHTYLLHDGRARSIEEAILWHGGEGAKSRNAFKKLSKKDREHLLRFLESL